MSEEPRCDVDGILCQIEALRSMRNLQSALGDETFLKEFPELGDLDSKLVKKISTSEGNLREALAQCGSVPLEEVEGITPEFGESEEESEGD